MCFRPFSPCLFSHTIATQTRRLYETIYQLLLFAQYQSTDALRIKHTHTAKNGQNMYYFRNVWMRIGGESDDISH